MKNLFYILILSFLFACSLFSQTEEKKEEGDYHNSSIFHLNKKLEDRGIYIISAKGGIGYFSGALSVGFDIPFFSNYENLAFRYNYVTNGNFGSGPKESSFFGLGVGFVGKSNDEYISKVNMYIGMGKARYRDNKKEKYVVCGGFGLDMLFGFEPFYISVSPELAVGPSSVFIGIALGLNGVF